MKQHATNGTDARHSIDVASLIDEGNWSPLQKLVLFLICLVAVVDGVDAQVLSLSLPLIVKDWGVPRAAFALVLAISFIAMAAGTAAGGLAGDRFGRKATMIGATFAFGAFTLAAAFTHSVLELGMLRALASLGLGAAMPNAVTLVAEYTPKRRRSMALGICMSSLPAGGMLLGFLGAYILPRHGWETLFIVAGILPIAISVALMAFLPESIRFLARQPAKAGKLHSIAVRMNPSIPVGARFIDSGEAAEQKKAKVSDVLTGEYARDTYLLSISFFFVVLATYLVYTWAPSLLSDMGYTAQYIGTSLSCFSLGGLLGGILGARIVQHLGSRRTFVGMSVGGSVCTGLMALASQLPQEQAALPLLIGLFLAGLLIPGTQAVIYVLAGQLYPTAIRATGIGIPAGFGRFGAVASAFVGPLLLAGQGLHFFLALCASMLVVGAALVAVRHRIGKG